MTAQGESEICISNTASIKRYLSKVNIAYNFFFGGLG